MKLMRAGRARWRIENETFNTLKNQGDEFEHNFGHGEKHLATMFAALMMLAFAIGQLQKICCPLLRAALAKTRRAKYFWEKLRGLFLHFHVRDWETLYKAIVHGHGSELVVHDTSSPRAGPRRARNAVLFRETTSPPPPSGSARRLHLASPSPATVSRKTRKQTAPLAEIAGWTVKSLGFMQLPGSVSSCAPKGATSPRAPSPGRWASSICAPCISSTSISSARRRARGRISPASAISEKIRPLLAGTYPLGDIARAQADFVGKDFIGKLVITTERAG